MAFINADLGESYHGWIVGQDAELIRYVDSVNIATGFHAGDPLTLERTLKLARQAQVKIAAHPGYKDIIGFGRRSLPFEPRKLAAEMRYQLGAFKACADYVGLEISYIKPHGALYHDMQEQPALFDCVLEAIVSILPQVPIMLATQAPDHWIYERAAKHDITLLKEAFLDRAYDQEGQLVSRDQAHALISDAEQLVARYQYYQDHGQIFLVDGSSWACEVDSWCLHGDSPNAVKMAQALHQARHPTDSALAVSSSEL